MLAVCAMGQIDSRPRTLSQGNGIRPRDSPSPQVVVRAVERSHMRRPLQEGKYTAFASGYIFCSYSCCRVPPLAEISRCLTHNFHVLLDSVMLLHSPCLFAC